MTAQHAATTAFFGHAVRVNFFHTGYITEVIHEIPIVIMMRTDSS